MQQLLILIIMADIALVSDHRSSAHGYLESIVANET